MKAGSCHDAFMTRNADGAGINRENLSAMFASIAGRYDLLNDILSAGFHRRWRRAFLAGLPKASSVALDLCTGSGAMLSALAERAETVLGLDACLAMEKQGIRMGRLEGIGNAFLIQADAHSVPLRENSVDLVTVAFGVRNFSNLERGLAEIFRVLRPGGTVAILELGQPQNAALRAIFQFYSRLLMPAAGAVIAGDAAAYRYLFETSSSFACRESFTTLLREAGFERCSWRPLTCGVAYIYQASRPENR